MIQYYPILIYPIRQYLLLSNTIQIRYSAVQYGTLQRSTYVEQRIRYQDVLFLEQLVDLEGESVVVTGSL